MSGLISDIAEPTLLRPKGDMSRPMAMLSMTASALSKYSF